MFFLTRDKSPFHEYTHTATEIRRCLIAKQTQSAPIPVDAEKSRAFAMEAAKLAAQTRCHNVVVLDVHGLSPVCDYFVIASGTSARQMRAVADEIIELAEKQDSKPIHTDGYEGESWVLVDFVDVIVHLFSDEARSYYDLDNLWGDANRIEISAQ
jgi:ribosome-associated protein